MIKFDVTNTRIAAVRAVKLVVAIRRLVKPMGLDTREFAEMEREFRAAAGELQRVEVEGAGDEERPLLGA